ncbi:PfaB family protein [uncultured Shewanella sp.]|uniref:PfaB family protein n=1 Tax=uncultured Shewanella sp. TaxID=173975 RepID=UPI00263898F1|nr:PfaB family protein [uncultured Shewanella sp.]
MSQAIMLAYNPLNMANVQAQTNMSDMPLRIALFVVPNLPTLKQALAKISLSYLSLLEAKFTITDLPLTSFEGDLQLAIERLKNNELSDDITHQSKKNVCVQIRNTTHRLLMIPALQAAKLKWSSHAILSSAQFASSAQAPQEMQTLAILQHNALLQAKVMHRQTEIKHHTIYTHNAENKFAKLIELINQMMSRTYKNNNHESFWFSAPFKGRVTTLNFLPSKKQSSSKIFEHTLDSERTTNESMSSIVLFQGSDLVNAKPLLHSSRLFFIVTGNNLAQLRQTLVQLETNIRSNSDDITLMMQQNLIDFTQRQQAAHSIKKAIIAPKELTLTLVIQATSLFELVQEITSMLSRLANQLDSQKPYHTPAGSVFFPAPQGEQGLTFVYPGVGTVYPNMFNELYAYFPQLFAQLEQEGHLSAMLQADKIYSAYQSNQIDATSDKKEVTSNKKKVPTKTLNLNDMSLAELAIAGVGTSYLFTQLLTRTFKLTPRFALGYSMGEAAMWASLGVWKTPHQLIDKTLNDPLFTSMVSGTLNTVKQAWQQTEPIHWNSFLVRASVDEINTLLPQYPRVYLAIIQGDTCIISGCETQCTALLNALNKRGIATNRVTAMHTPPAMNVHSDVVHFYHQDIKQENDALRIKTQFIAAAQPQAFSFQQSDNTLAITANKIAHSLADNFCQPLNFPALIQKAQKKGAKLFVEIGADRQNTTLINKIFSQNIDGQQQDHAMAINTKGGDSISDLLKVLAQLISQNVPLSLTPLLMSFEPNNHPIFPPMTHTIFDKGEVNVFS